MRYLNQLLCFCLLSLSINHGLAESLKKPKLILQITLDQFAGNQLDRFKTHLKDGGFAYLIEHGFWYDNAHQPHATTQTAVGHTTLATGSVPALHGIIANHWWDKASTKSMYAFYDDRYPIIGDKSEHKHFYGRSPKNMAVPSFSDSLAINSAGKAKHFAISTKDRGAIPLAGHMGKAFWFDRRTGQYVTSQYYYKKLPSWLVKWNQKHKADIYLGKAWQIKNDCHRYIYCNNKTKHFVSTRKAYKTTPPHPYGNRLNKDYYRNLMISPISDALTLEVSRELIKAEALGQNQTTDYLSISLSATDAIGHTFGPNSLESEDNFIKLNQHLKTFFAFIDKKVGLANTLIVLSADHGVAPSPTYLQPFHYPSFEVDVKSIKNNPAVVEFFKKYQLSWQQLVIEGAPDVYLNEKALHAKKLDKGVISQEFARALQAVPGIAYAISRQEIESGQFNIPLLKQALLNQINPKRSGDIYLVPAPFCYISDKPYSKVHHGSPWRYDTHVPIIFAHPSFKGQRLHQQVLTTDIAATLAAMMNITLPAASTGKVLPRFR